MNELERVWLACAIDGEGSIGFMKSGGTYCPYIAVVNDDIRFVEKASQITCKGQISVDKKERRGEHPWRQTYLWRVRKQSDCYELLNEIKPYLIIKRDLAEKVLLYIRFRKQKGKSTKGGITERILATGNESEIKDIQELI